MYKLTEVRIICEIYYGRKISKRTWIYWKQLAKVPEYIREVTEQKAGHILAVVILRKRQPKMKITFVDVFKCAITEVAEIGRILREKVDVNTPIPPTTCEGRKLPEYIEGVTGRKVSEKTLYRWGKEHGFEYGRHRTYDTSELDFWTELALTA